MTDIYIGITLVGITFASALLYMICRALYRRMHDDLTEPASNVHPVQDYRYNPAASIVETNSGFTSGAIIGAGLNSHRTIHTIPSPDAIRQIEENIRNRANHMAEDDSALIIAGSILAASAMDNCLLAPEPQTEAFTGYSGGDSAGGGATSNWDTPDNCPIDNSGDSNSSNSSCDTGPSTDDTGSSTDYSGSDSPSSNDSSSSSDY